MPYPQYDKPWDVRAARLFMRLAGVKPLPVTTLGGPGDGEIHAPDRMLDADYRVVRLYDSWDAGTKWAKLAAVLEAKPSRISGAAGLLAKFLHEPLPTDDLDFAALHQLMLEKGVDALPDQI